MRNSIAGANLSGRREMLKSALMTAAVCAGLPAGGSPSRAAGRAGPPSSPGPLSKGMIAFTLSHEQFPVPELVRLGAAAENAGFDLVATSDHFQPWQANERHSGLAWVTLGALAQKTQRIWMGTAVTCPTLRYRPAVVAEAFGIPKHP
jgi:F420-dependent hydroxymycolic acid dehydrogenase